MHSKGERSLVNLNSTIAGSTAGLYWPGPTSPVLPGSELVLCSTLSTPEQYLRQQYENEQPLCSSQYLRGY